MPGFQDPMAAEALALAIMGDHGPQTAHQFTDAIYHVINRGNYRQDVFALESTRKAFEQCLFEACEQAGWLLHAYTIMINHFHLAIQAPRANLTEGMHWLESTFAARFNRFRREQGTLFQGRYKALLVEPGSALASVVNYIHLNPVKAGVVAVRDLARFSWSSFCRFQRLPRPSFCVCSDWMFEMGKLNDSPAGWRSYHDYLIWLAADEIEQKRQAFDTLCQGWATGSEAWRRGVGADHAQTLGTSELRGGEGAVELKEMIWGQALDRFLAQCGKTRIDAAEDKKGAQWKIDIAVKLRSSTTARNSWIARELNMGTADCVSVYLSFERRRGRI